ncbi:LysR family transcriptional regulator [Yunchengibacter salinarum]|uniref:LysR family transcriptional regulator n=1 Tax=Yunchengibacter salinarum TaxID=3133399 RepID=UPI0035B65077
MFDLYLLKYFLAVVEAGSFTRAAETVYVTQPTLSAGIKKLEGQLGCALFVRSSRRVFLTDAGSRFLPRAKAILHECNMAEEAVAQGMGGAVLRLGVLTTLDHRRVAAMIRAFRASPAPAFEIVDGTEQELLNRLDDRSIDYALSLHRGESADEAVPLLEEGYVFVLARDHPLSGRPRLMAEDLRAEPMVVRSRCEVLSETSRYFTDRNVRPRLAYRTANDSRALAMVAAGVGGTVVPDSLVTDDVAARPLDGFAPRRRLALFRPRSALPQGLAAVAPAFEDHVATCFSTGAMNGSPQVTHI